MVGPPELGISGLVVHVVRHGGAGNGREPLEVALFLCPLSLYFGDYVRPESGLREGSRRVSLQGITQRSEVNVSLGVEWWRQQELRFILEAVCPRSCLPEGETAFFILSLPATSLNSELSPNQSLS